MADENSKETPTIGTRIEAELAKVEQPAKNEFVRVESWYSKHVNKIVAGLIIALIVLGVVLIFKA